MSEIKVALTDDELLLLDGRCREDVQKQVNRAKMRRQFSRPLIGDAVIEARNTGNLVYAHKSLEFCRLCKKTGGYAPYKSGPNKGQPNYKKPRRIAGVELAERFVTMEGHVTLGGCYSCIEPLLPDLVEALSKERCQLPDALAKPGSQRYVRYDLRHCTQCDWRGHEGEMGRLHKLFGDGTYAGKCPSCGAEDKILNRDIVERVDGFVVVPCASSTPFAIRSVGGNR